MTALQRRQSLSLIFLAATAGCAKPIKPCYGTEAGQEYDIELLERWDEDSSYAGGSNAYGPDLDIWEGDRIRIVVESHEHHGAAGCKNAVFRPVAPKEHGWEILSSRPQEASMVFVGQFDARIGDCEGLLQMYVDERRQAPDLYSAPHVGEPPNFFLDRQFLSSDCAAIDQGGCGDRFVVQIHPVE